VITVSTVYGTFAANDFTNCARHGFFFCISEMMDYVFWSLQLSRLVAWFIEIVNLMTTATLQAVQWYDGICQEVLITGGALCFVATWEIFFCVVSFNLIYGHTWPSSRRWICFRKDSGALELHSYHQQGFRNYLSSPGRNKN